MVTVFFFRLSGLKSFYKSTNITKNEQSFFVI